MPSCIINRVQFNPGKMTNWSTQCYSLHTSFTFSLEIDCACCMRKRSPHDLSCMLHLWPEYHIKRIHMYMKVCKVHLHVHVLLNQTSYIPQAGPQGEGECAIVCTVCVCEHVHIHVTETVNMYVHMYMYMYMYIVYVYMYFDVVYSRQLTSPQYTNTVTSPLSSFKMGTKYSLKRHTTLYGLPS